jgi:hypothetical protein
MKLMRFITHFREANRAIQLNGPEGRISVDLSVIGCPSSRNGVLEYWMKNDSQVPTMSNGALAV